MFLAAGHAAALGLGRLTVQSALGETLRAEIDVTSLTPEESANLTARVAPPDAYRAAGVEYNAVLTGTRVTLERRPDGRPYLRVISERAVQEPFVDVILELSWTSGRLVREYTLLLDPPTRRAATPAPATAPIVSAPVPAPATAAPSSEPRPAVTARPSTPAPVPAPAPAPAAEAAQVDEYQVRRGDTLYGVAARVQRPGVSLDQMLVALYQANPQAFIGENMNRLRAGAVLSVPGAEQAQSVTPSEARQLIQAQSADFNAFRQRLASAAQQTAADEPTRQASGRVEAAVEDRRQAGDTAPDRLTLSKGAVAAAPGASAEDRIAQERQRQEAASRVAELSRNVEELKRIAPEGAPAAPAPAPAATPSPAPAVTVPVAPVPAPTPAPAAEPAVVAQAPAEAPQAASEPASAAMDEPASAAEAPASEPAVAEAPPAPAPAPQPVPMPVPSEPSLIDDLLANPLVLPLAGGLVALLVGLGVYRLRSRTKKDSGETSFLESRLQPDSFFGASGGQRVDTKDASGAPSSLSYSLSQLDAIGDVDPVAEADVYLAYGRDLQAEEILKEAMRANPERLAIRTKLLEVYAKRRDSKGFELLATQLYGLTAGQGEDWARAQELGRQIDPDNKLYQPGGAPAESAKLPEGGYEPLGASTMPQSVMPTPSKFSDVPPAKGDVDLDLDLPLGNEAPARAFDTEATKPLAAAPMAAPTFSAPAPSLTDEPDAGMSFELPELPAAGTPAVQARSEGPSSRSMDFDLGDISLDLGSTAPGRGAPADELAGLDLGEGGDESGDPMERKLELAEEFRQIGDREGARELLQEVVSKSSGALRAKAQSMLAELA
jgi:pilus assembly protein FimV